MASQNKIEKLSVRQSIPIPILGGEMEGIFYTFKNVPDGKEHFAIELGTPSQSKPPLVRLHSECITGDVFVSERCDCGPQLQESIRTIAKEGGYLLYLRQEGRGIGLYAKLDAYLLQYQGLDTYEANQSLGFENDLRDYSVAANMLKALGVNRVRLLSNNPDKVEQLRDHNIDVSKVVPTGVHVTPHNREYLSAKIAHTNHTIVLENV